MSRLIIHIIIIHIIIIIILNTLGSKYPEGLKDSLKLSYYYYCYY